MTVFCLASPPCKRVRAVQKFLVEDKGGGQSEKGRRTGKKKHYILFSRHLLLRISEFYKTKVHGIEQW
jgi:hypothetical protein